MKYLFVLCLVLLLTMTVPVSASAELLSRNEYGYVDAWFNGQKATVKNVTLKIGEPADINVTVTSNISGNVYVVLINPLVTEPYDVVRGPSKIGEYNDNYDVVPGWSKTYTWTIAPNGAWTNGNAPINIFVEFSKQGEDKKIQFTIANPVILNEKYTSSASSQTQSPQSGATEETDQKSDSPQQPATSSFLYIYLVLIGAAVIVILVLFKMRKPK